MSVSEVTVKIKDTDGLKFNQKSLVYDEFEVSLSDPVLFSLVESAKEKVKVMGEQDIDVMIKIRWS